MTDQDYRHYIVIADRSGSIGDVPGFRTEMENGINTFIADRKDDPGRATVTLHEFDTRQDTLFSFIPAAEAQRYKLVPRGATALHDAIGIVFASEGIKLAAMPEDDRPGKVVVLIATDGKENSSHEYLNKIAPIITEQREKYGWEILYIGANQDAVQVAETMGIPVASAATYDAAPTAARVAFRSSSNLAGRGARGQSYSYTDAERAAMKEDEKP